MKIVMSVAAAIALAGCVSTNVTPLAQNVVLISTSAAPACSGRSTQQIAYSQAARETIRRGYDLFVIVGAESANNVRVTGFTSTVYGVNATYGGSRDQDLAVEMFRYGDPAGANALDARAELGPDWQAKVAQDRNNCF